MPCFCPSIMRFSAPPLNPPVMLRSMSMCVMPSLSLYCFVDSWSVTIETNWYSYQYPRDQCKCSNLKRTCLFHQGRPWRARKSSNPSHNLVATTHSPVMFASVTELGAAIFLAWWTWLAILDLGLIPERDPKQVEIDPFHAHAARETRRMLPEDWLELMLQHILCYQLIEYC